MNDVVICEPIRTPVGRQGGVLAPLSAVDLASTVLTELVRRTGLARGRRRRRGPGPVLRERRVPRHRPDRGPRRGPRHRGPRPPDRPALRLGPAGGAVRRRPGRDRRRVGGGGGRRRVDVAGRALRTRPADRRAIRRHRADGPARPGARDRGRPVPPGPGRHDRDGREPPRGVRHLPRGAGRAGGPLPAAGGGRPGAGPVRRGDRAGHGAREARQARRRRGPRRAPPTGHHRRRTSPGCDPSGWASTTRRP